MHATEPESQNSTAALQFNGLNEMLVSNQWVRGSQEKKSPNPVLSLPE
jgi:hypothetical protein